MKKFDIVLFGATGFTGKFIANELAKIFLNENFTWAIAGRSQVKLNLLLTSIDQDLSGKVDTLIVDVNDAQSILEMCQKAKIIINCVGPYRFYGESIVNECLKTNTHHIDVSGEPEFLERMQLNYDETAFNSNTYIIGSCGFDSVPADLGFLFTKNEFVGQLSHVDSYLSICSNGGSVNINYATWESLIHGFANAKNLGPIRKRLFEKKLPKPKFKSPNRFGYFYDNYLKKYAMPFFGSDKSVVQRSEYFNYKKFDQRPVQYNAFFTIDTIGYVLRFLFFGGLLKFLIGYAFGRSLLLKHYKCFTNGLVRKNEMSFDQMNKVSFKMSFIGSGWNDRLTNVNEDYLTRPNQTIETMVTGPEPGYIATSKIVVNCAVVLLKEQNKIPVKGGVLTPAIAFASTSLIERLRNCGFKFEKISKTPGIQQPTANL